MRNLRRGVLVVVAILMAIVASIQTSGVARATDTSAQGFLNNQNYNKLISDSNFININSMSVTDVQNFLVSKGSDLATISTTHLGSGANGRSAAQIIYDAAHAADSASSGCAQSICIDTGTGTISPKAILITLQKEEGLITNWKYTGSNQWQLDSAMGYGCPDSGGCSSTYAGFANQVGWGAWQLRWNYEMSQAGKSGVAPYIVGGSLPNMTYNLADLNISGSVTVYLSNSSTASLYRYTPHLFYGNYNFWQLGISWFGFDGSTAGTPGGSNDTSGFSAGTYGSTFKASGTKSTNVKAVYNSKVIADFNTTTWSVTMAVSLGTHKYAINYINSDGSTAGTKTITIDRRKVGDINDDGHVDILDLSLLVNNWNQTVRGDNWVNLNPDVDSKVDILDLSLMVNNWGS